MGFSRVMGDGATQHTIRLHRALALARESRLEYLSTMVLDSPSGPPAHLSSPVQMSVIHYPHRWDELLELRRSVYRGSNKKGPDSAREDTIDPRDRAASMVITELDGRIVGSIRLTLPLPGPFLHHECVLTGPTHLLPSPEDCVEASWACVHPDFRGHGLLWLIAAHMLITARSFGRPYLVGSTDEILWRFWQRCGFQRTEVAYSGLLSGTRYRLMTLDLEAVLAGQGIASRLAQVLEPLLASRRQERPADSEGSTGRKGS